MPHETPHIGTVRTPDDLTGGAADRGPAERGAPHEHGGAADRGASRKPGVSFDALGAVEAGLDVLQSAPASTPGRTRTALAALYPPVVAVAVLLAIWQVVVWLEIQPVYNLPGPAQVVNAAGRAAASGALGEALGTSLSRGVVGFLAAVALGTPLGVVVARVRWVRVSFGPVITGLQVLPSVAWVPAAIIWFGLSDATVYFVVLMGAVPSIVNGIVAGVDQVPPLYRSVGRVLGAGRFALVRDVILPAALPGYLAGLKQGWAFSWRSLMAAEIIAVGGSIGFGLGAFLQQGRELSDMAMVFTAILLILVVGIAIELLFFAPVERAVLRRRGLAAGAALAGGWVSGRRAGGGARRAAVGVRGGARRSEVGVRGGAGPAEADARSGRPAGDESALSRGGRP